MGGIIHSIYVEIGAGSDTDTEELAQLSLGLRDELLELDVEAVDGVGGEPVPDGAKGHGSGAVSTLVVALSNSAVVVALSGLLRSWVSRRAGRTVTLRFGEDSIEISEASAEQQAKLIESWLDRHARGGG